MTFKHKGEGDNIYIGCEVIQMEIVTSAISVQVDTKDKERANNILKSLGLNMSTFVNMAIKQLIYTDGLPFEVKNPKQDNQLLMALKKS